MKQINLISVLLIVLFFSTNITKAQEDANKLKLSILKLGKPMFNYLVFYLKILM